MTGFNSVNDAESMMRSLSLKSPRNGAAMVKPLPEPAKYKPPQCVSPKFSPRRIIQQPRQIRISLVCVRASNWNQQGQSLVLVIFSNVHSSCNIQFICPTGSVQIEFPLTMRGRNKPQKRSVNVVGFQISNERVVIYCISSLICCKEACILSLYPLLFIRFSCTESS